MPDARPEESQIVRREVRDGLEHQQNVAQHGASVAGRERKDRRRDEHRLRVLGESNPRRRRQMIGCLSSVERRRSAHGVDDVLVETWEESKPMFAGQPVLDGARRRRWRADVRLCPSPSSMTGMLRALPPAKSLRSSTTTSKPRSTSSCAALMPATPPPRYDDPSRHVAWASRREGAWSDGTYLGSLPMIGAY